MSTIECTCAYVPGDGGHEFHCDTRAELAEVTESKPCFWRCGDPDPEHKHYAVSVRENGKLLGRLTPDGTTNHLKIFSVVLSKEQAESIARDITEADNGGLTATAIPF